MEAMKEILRGKPVSQAAKDNSIKVGTLRSRINKYEQRGSHKKPKRGPPKKHVDFTDPMYRHICKYVDHNSIASHDDIFEDFQNKFGDDDITRIKLKKYVQQNFAVMLRRHQTFPPQEEAAEDYTGDYFDSFFHELFRQNVVPRRCVFVNEVAYDVDPHRHYQDNEKKKYRNAKAKVQYRPIKIPTKEKTEKPISTKMAFLVAFSYDQVVYTKYQIGTNTTEDDVRKFVRMLVSIMGKKEM